MKSRRFPLATRLLSVFVMTSYIVNLQAPARAACCTTPTKPTNGGKKWVIQLAFRPVIGATPAPKDGATPAPKDGATPAPKDGATPAPKDGATPAPKDGATPAPKDGATPAPKDGATPAPKDGATPAPKDGATPAPKDGATPAPKDGATPAPKDYDPFGFLVGSHGNHNMTEYGSKEVGLTDRATIAMLAYVPKGQIDLLYLDVGADHWSTGQTSDTVTDNAQALAYFVELNDAGAIVDSCWEYDPGKITDKLTPSGHTLGWKGSTNSPPPYGVPLYATVAKLCP